jgi:proteic killer suppression protein
LVKSDKIEADLDIQYRSKKIRELCEKQAVAEKKLGAACARKLLLRLQQLEAAARVTELVAGNPHPLKGDRDGQFALDLAGGWRLVFSPANEPYPTRPDGGIDWSQVTIVSIEYIGDYHD